MIIRMAKIEIAGPKELLLPAIDSARTLGCLQLEPEPDRSTFADAEALKSLMLNEEELGEHFFCQELKEKTCPL